MRLARWFYPKVELVLPWLAHEWSYRMFFTPFKYDRPDREKTTKATAEIWFKEINDKKTAFYSWGDHENPVVVMVHGWMGRATQFHRIIEDLLQANFRVVAFDGPAHGASEGKRTDLRDFSKALVCIEQELGPLTLGIGHSFGGVAILFAKENGLALKNVITIASPTIGDDIINQFTTQVNGTQSTSKAFKRKFKQNFKADFSWFSLEELVKRIHLDNLFIIHDYDDTDVPIQHAFRVAESNRFIKTRFTTGLGHNRILRNKDTSAYIVDIAKKLISSSPKNETKNVDLIQ